MPSIDAPRGSLGRDAKPNRGPNSAFLLAQLGAHAAQIFGRLVAEVDLSPPLAGLLRAVATGPGRSQQEIATQLGTPPARMVALVDDLDERGLVERRRNPDDRRLNALYLTDTGQSTLKTLGRIAGQHDNLLLAALDQTEREQLHDLLTRVVTQQGLARGVHPGYRNLGAPKRD
ncbi:MAG: MarR family winged helix-turn-helix transcriptional regulator [Jatrophihabitans sp.]